MGTGEGVASGLELLLAQAQGRRRPCPPALKAMRDRLRDAGRAINVVTALKELHDLLHTAQVYRFDRIVEEASHFPDSELALINLPVYADELKDDVTAIERVRTTKSLQVSVTWVEMLGRAAADLSAGASAGDVARVRRAVSGMQVVFGQLPTQVNGALMAAVRELPLADLGNVMRSVLATLGRRCRRDEGEMAPTAGRLDR